MTQPREMTHPRTKVVLQSRQFSSSSSRDTPRTKVVLYKVASSQRTIPAEGCPRPGQIALSPAFRAHTRDPRRGLSRTGTNRTLVCISRPRHARSPQRVARAKTKSHSRLHFAHSTRTISAEGCAGQRQIALSPAFRALERVARAKSKTHSRLHFAHSSRTETNHTLALISRTRHARSPQRVARAKTKSHSRLHFAHSTRTISAEGCVSWRSGGTAPGLKRES